MAGAKHSAKVSQPQKKYIGARVFYAGMIQKECAGCNRTWRRGMMSVYEGKDYCSEACVLKEHHVA